MQVGEEAQLMEIIRFWCQLIIWRYLLYYNSLYWDSSSSSWFLLSFSTKISKSWYFLSFNRFDILHDFLIILTFQIELDSKIILLHQLETETARQKKCKKIKYYICLIAIFFCFFSLVILIILIAMGRIIIINWWKFLLSCIS